MTREDGVVAVEWNDPMDGDKPKIIGMGILIDKLHVLTCAHVVCRALGKDPEDASYRPAQTEAVQLRFVLDSNGNQTRSGTVRLWHPFNDPSKIPDDLAVLELDSPVETVTPARFADHSGSAPIEAFGFPSVTSEGILEVDPRGQWVAGQVGGAVRMHRRQLDGRWWRRLFIEQGYSGTGVYNPKRCRLVGIACEKNPGPQDKIARMIAAGALVRTPWPIPVDPPQTAPTPIAPSRRELAPLFLLFGLICVVLLALVLVQREAVIHILSSVLLVLSFGIVAFCIFYSLHR